ncbi:PRELI-like family-domain-containing protein [Baffinella frigidus]|nr:PRELI-like family-domain-containing protein [Cryptophyta sp. CCMP2293]
MADSRGREGHYAFSFDRVSAALWDKYEGHQQVESVEVLERRVDEDDRLHSRRLLTMYGQLPAVLRPLFGPKPLYLVEEVIVDPKRRELEIRTRNINFNNVFVSQSVSHYRESENDPAETDYTIHLDTTAFPKEGQARGGRLSKIVEDFACRKLLGNIKQGEEDIIRIITGRDRPQPEGEPRS